MLGIYCENGLKKTRTSVSYSENVYCSKMIGSIFMSFCRSRTGDLRLAVFLEARVRNIGVGIVVIGFLLSLFGCSKESEDKKANQRGVEQASEARLAMNSLLDEGMTVALHLLEKNGEFYPFAVGLQFDSKIAIVATLDGDDHPESNDVLASLYPALREDIRKGEYTAVGIVTNVTVRKNETDEPIDALRIQIEHPEAEPMACFVPYRLENGKVIKGELVAQWAEPLVIDNEQKD